MAVFEGELIPKIDFSSFEHLAIVEHYMKVFLKAVSRVVKKNLMFCNESTRFDRQLNMRCQRLFMT